MTAPKAIITNSGPTGERANKMAQTAQVIWVGTCMAVGGLAQLIRNFI